MVIVNKILLKGVLLEVLGSTSKLPLLNILNIAQENRSDA